MKKGIFSIFLFFAGVLFLFPVNTNALEQLKKCTYGDNSNQIVITMYQDYSINAYLKKNGKNQDLKTPNWKQLVDYVKTTTNAKCPTYAVLASDLENVNFSNNKKSATTLETKTTGTTFGLSQETFVKNKNGIDEEIISCGYQFTVGGERTKLTYKIYSNGRVGVPFSDNSDYLNNGKTWYHADQFSDKFYSSSKISNTEYTCPSLTILENETGFTVFPNGASQCGNKCYRVTANSVLLSDSAKDNKFTSKKVVSGCTGPSVAIYNSKSYFFPYFRAYSDGNKEWSIDGKNFFPASKKITGKVNGKSLQLTINKTLLNDIFSGTKVQCPSKIYRCVNSKNDGYSYELSTSATACSEDELGSSDGQGFGSTYASGAFGTPSGDERDRAVTIDDLREDLEYGQPSDCKSILGSVGDEESVAWLLQQLLNYLKVLGPILVVILSSMDFAKAIVISDDENMKKAQKKLVVRLVAALALFLVPTLVEVLLDLFGITSDASCVLK